MPQFVNPLNLDAVPMDKLLNMTNWVLIVQNVKMKKIALLQNMDVVAMDVLLKMMKKVPIAHKLKKITVFIVNLDVAQMDKLTELTFLEVIVQKENVNILVGAAVVMELQEKLILMDLIVHNLDVMALNLVVVLMNLLKKLMLMELIVPVDLQNGVVVKME